MLFARTHIDGQRPRRWQTQEFIGDRIYARCLVQVLSHWNLPGACITVLYQVLTSNRYIQRLCAKFNLLDYCIGVAGQPIEDTMRNKAQADAFEVLAIRGSRAYFVGLMQGLLCRCIQRSIV